MLLYEEVTKIAFRKDYRVADWQIWKSFFCILMLIDVPPFKKKYTCNFTGRMKESL